MWGALAGSLLRTSCLNSYPLSWFWGCFFSPPKDSRNMQSPVSFGRMQSLLLLYYKQRRCLGIMRS